MTSIISQGLKKEMAKRNGLRKGSTTTILMKWFFAECRGRAQSIERDRDQLLWVTFEAAEAAHRFLQLC